MRSPTATRKPAPACKTPGLLAERSKRGLPVPARKDRPGADTFARPGGAAPASFGARLGPGAPALGRPGAGVERPGAGVAARAELTEAQRVGCANVVRANLFERGRPLSAYEAMLGAEFAADCAALGRDDHILDAGAGELRAMRELAAGRPDAERPSITAVTLVAAEQNIEVLAAHERARVLAGRLFDDIPDEELRGAAGKFSRIVDVFGVFCYSPDPDRVLARYLRNLAPGGKIYLIATQRHLVLRGTRALSLPDWLASLPDLAVRHVPENPEALCIQPRVERPTVPELTLLVRIRQPLPPERRHYAEVTTAPAAGDRIADGRTTKEGTENGLEVFGPAPG